MQRHSKNIGPGCTKQIDDPQPVGTLANPQRHDELLNYRLKRLVTLGGAPAIRLCEGRFGVARFEWRLLAALVEEGPRSPSALARRTGLDPARVSRTLASLAAKRLVAREVIHEREQRVNVRATEAGRRLYASLWPLLAGLNRRLMSVLDANEAVVFERCLLKLTEHAARIHAEPSSAEVKTHRRLGGSRRVWETAVAAAHVGSQ